jgi:transcriptional repressor NrdR
MRCPRCGGLDDKVVDSRAADDGGTIRRRRQCLACDARFTTYERIEEIPLVVVKRSGQRVAFDRAKVAGGVRAAAKNRPLSDEELGALAEAIEDHLRVSGVSEVTSEQVGLAVLERLRQLDQVAYVRFASVYRGFSEPADFEREITLLAKSSEPKQH